MSAPIIPVPLRNLAILTLDSAVYYFDKSGAKFTTRRDTETVTDDFFGAVQTRAKGGAVVDLTFTPTGIIRNLGKIYPFSGDGIANWRSQSIIKGAALISDTGGKTISYARAGILKPPTMTLHPNKPLWGQMTVRCLNKVDVAPTNAAALLTHASASFTDVSFDEALIAGDNYAAALGARTTPFNAIGSRTGFELEPVYSTEDVTDDGYGIVDTLVTEIGWRCKFSPNNLTAIEHTQLGNWQDADAIMAGMTGPATAEDLVISGDPMDVTLHNVFCTAAENGKGAKVDQNGNVEFVVGRMQFTAGVPQPQIEFTVNLGA